MSLLSDFKNQHVDVRAFILCVLLITPLWYIAIYLFHKTFYNSSPIYLPIVFAYCLTICSTFLPLFSVLIFLSTVENKKPSDEEKNKEDLSEKKEQSSNTDHYYMGFALTIAILSLGVFTSREEKKTFDEFIMRIMNWEIIVFGISSSILIVSKLIKWIRKNFSILIVPKLIKWIRKKIIK